MNNSPERRRQLIIIIAGLALFAGWKIVVEPYMASWKKHNANIAKLQKDIADGNRLRAQGAAIRSDWKNKKENSLPLDEIAAQEILSKAKDAWQGQSGVIQNNFTQSRPREDDTFTSIEGKLDISGNAGQVLRFLYAMEKDPLAIRLKSFDVDSKDNGQTLSLGLLVSGLVLTKPDK